MECTRRAPIVFLGGMLGVSLLICVPYMVFGEYFSPIPMEGKRTKTESLPRETKNELKSIPPGSTGFRSEESKKERASDDVSPIQSAVSVEDQELVETTDASGGVMIDLKGRFQSVLKVPSAAEDTRVREPLPPVVP